MPLKIDFDAAFPRKVNPGSPKMVPVVGAALPKIELVSGAEMRIDGAKDRLILKYVINFFVFFLVGHTSVKRVNIGIFAQMSAISPNNKDASLALGCRHLIFNILRYRNRKKNLG